MHLSVAVASAGATLGPFPVAALRHPAALMVVVSLGGATSISAVLDASADGGIWEQVASAGPAGTAGDTLWCIGAEHLPWFQVRLSVAAPGGWAGSAQCGVEIADPEPVQDELPQPAEALDQRRQEIERVRESLGPDPSRPVRPMEPVLRALGL